MISDSELAITRVRELRMLMSCLNINLAGHAKISNTVGIPGKQENGTEGPA